MDETGNHAKAYFADVRGRVNARLADYFAERADEIERVSPDSMMLLEGIRDLTLRGGKRLRPIAVACAYEAVRPGGDPAPTIDAGAALELLQTGLLIHDDWMDQDDERRGGPAVHVAYRAHHPDPHAADCIGVLAGSLAYTFGWELMLEASFPEGRRMEGLQAFIQVQKDVHFGQQLDVMGNRDVSRMHQLKTGSYTVRGPLRLGALLGDATPEQLDALDRWGTPLGGAFQLRDDLLGTFGDSGATGKPGDDLRHGKLTALVLEAERVLDEKTRAPLTRVFGSYEATDAEFDDALQMLEEQGIRRTIEESLDAMIHEAGEILTSAPLSPEGVTLLTRLADMLALRIS